MKNIFLLLALVMVPRLVNAQCGPPPPPGQNILYSVDMDNDGLAPFDIGYHITIELRPMLEELYAVSSSGYDLLYHNSLGEPTEMIYTNIVPNEDLYLESTYTGNGPQFAFAPPCYWPIGLYGGLMLDAMPFDGDFDGDGILNAHEDSNGNLNLMDDDYDADGIINLIDADDLMSVSMFSDISMVIFPNPAKGTFQIQSTSAISKVSISDLTGKIVAEYNSPSSEITIAQLLKGMYIVTIKSEGLTAIKKLIVE